MFDFDDNDSLADEAIFTAAMFGMADEEARDEIEINKEVAEDTFREYQDIENSRKKAISLDEADKPERKYIHPDDPQGEPFMAWVDDVIAGRKKITDEL